MRCRQYCVDQLKRWQCTKTPASQKPWQLALVAGLRLWVNETDLICDSSFSTRVLNCSWTSYNINFSVFWFLPSLRWR